VLEVLASSSLRASIVSEESEATMVADSGDCWYVDPLDGTSAFLFRVGDPFPSVLVALHRQQLPLVGVVLFPLTGECFYSHAGMGAYKDGRRMELPAPRRLQDVWIDMNQYGNARYETGMFAYLRNKLRTREGAKLVTTLGLRCGCSMDRPLYRRWFTTTTQRVSSKRLGTSRLPMRFSMRPGDVF